MWFIYALIGAFGKAYSGFFRKKMAFSVSADTYMWISFSIMLLLLVPVMAPHFDEILTMTKQLPLAVLGASLALIFATHLNLQALKKEELSYIAPLNAFVPVFTLIIAGIFLNDSPPKFGIIGILAIVLGAYIINIKPDRVKWYDPLKHLLSNTGARLSIGVAIGYAVNTVLFKVILNQGYSSITTIYVTSLFCWLLLIYVPIVKSREIKVALNSSRAVILGAAVSSFIGSYFHILAVASTYASYAVGVRRFESIIAIVLGWRYLKETNIKLKLIGSFCMIMGGVFMAIS